MVQLHSMGQYYRILVCIIQWHTYHWNTSKCFFDIIVIPPYFSIPPFFLLLSYSTWFLVFLLWYCVHPLQQQAIITLNTPIQYACPKCCPTRPAHRLNQANHPSSHLCKSPPDTIQPPWRARPPTQQQLRRIDRCCASCSQDDVAPSFWASEHV